MRGLPGRAALVLVTLVVAVLAGLYPSAAAAGEPGLVVEAPETAAAGEIVEVRVAAMSDDDQPATGVTITVAYWAEFGGVGNWLEVARAVTAEDGAVTLSFEQRSFGVNELRVEQLDAEGNATDSLTVTLTETPGGPQLYRSSAGVSIPWLNASAVIIAVGAVWGFLVYAAFQLYLVSRPGRAAPTDDEVAPDPELTPDDEVAPDDERPLVSAGRGDRGAVSFGMAIATIVTAIAITMLIVVARNPLTHANLDGPDDYDRTPVAYLEEDQPYTGVGDTSDPDATGEDLYFIAGCAGCHTPTGEGGIGPDLVGELESLRQFTSDLRDGPDTMPAYPADVLTDEQIKAIHDYLTELEALDS